MEPWSPGGWCPGWNPEWNPERKPDERGRATRLQRATRWALQGVQLVTSSSSPVSSSHPRRRLVQDGGHTGSARRASCDGPDNHERRPLAGIDHISNDAPRGCGCGWLSITSSIPRPVPSSALLPSPIPWPVARGRAP